MSVGSPNSLKSPTDSKHYTDTSHMNGQKSKLNGDYQHEPVPAQRKSTKKLVGGVAVLPTLNRSMSKDDEHKENRPSPVIYDYEPGRRTIQEQQVCQIFDKRN